MEAKHEPTKLSRTISTKVTNSEDEQIRGYAEAQKCELSAFVRRTLLAAVEGKTLRPADVMHLEIFVRTVEAWLEQGERFTVKKFREICGMVTAKSGVQRKPSGNGTGPDAQA